MASKNDSNGNHLQNSKHCVVIDGDFERHELFINIHPYTLNRLGKSNDAFTFKIYTEQALKLMNNASNIHYHICYNSFAIEIDKYYKVLKMIYPQSVWLHPSINTTVDKNNTENSTLKLEETMSNHESDYIWIIHGMENYHKELIERLKCNNNSTAKFYSYCWLENLKEGSNRIEYLVNNKMKSLTEDQTEQLFAESIFKIPVTITTESSKGEKKAKKIVKCDLEGCDKEFRNVNSLKDHQLAKHANTQPVINEETTTKEKPKKTGENPKIVCGFDNCKLSYKNLRALQKHQIETHSILLRCPFTQECLNSNEQYLGMRDLMSHIVFHHADSFPRRFCPIANCQNQKHGHDWFAALQHILQEHTNYLIDNIIPNAAEQQPTTSELDTRSIQTKPITNIPSWDLDGPFKCLHNNCDQWYWEEKGFKRHEAFEHPVALRCPFSFECQQSATEYIGLWNLRGHVIRTHAPLFSQPTCFDPECKMGEKKPFKSWPAVLRHILIIHLEAVVIISESTASSTTKKPQKAIKKCSYDTCNQLFNTREKFTYHLITCHPYPLRCPYNSEGNNIADSEVYLGLMELEKHIKAEHSVQFTEPMCFDNKCQREKHFQNWNLVVDHILGKHWLDTKLN